LSPEWFHSVDVQAGDMLIFRQTVPHYGPKNILEQPRVACFSMLSTNGRRGQDSKQVKTHAQAGGSIWTVLAQPLMLLLSLSVCLFRVQLYRHHYVREAFGASSPQYADALVHDAPFRTLSATTPRAKMWELMHVLKDTQRLQAYIQAATYGDRLFAQAEAKRPASKEKKKKPPPKRQRRK